MSEPQSNVPSPAECTPLTHLDGQADAAASAPTLTHPPSPTISRGHSWLIEKQRTMDLRGKAYLQVADRVAALRMDHPDWGIKTELIEGGLLEKFVVWQATITNEKGEIIATGRKVETEPPKDSRECQDWYEKGETGAIGRACGTAGYGTVFALEENPDRPCDAPRERTQARPQQPQRPPAARPAPPKPTADLSKPAAPAPVCVVCSKPVDNPGRVKYCESKSLPPSCIDKTCSGNEKALVTVAKG